MNFQAAIQEQLDRGFSQVENRQNRRFVGARIEQDGTMTIVALARDYDDNITSQVIENAEANNLSAFKMAMKFKERGLW